MPDVKAASEMKLGMAFAFLVALLIGIGYLGLSRMNQINANLNDVVGEQWITLHWSREALAYSSRNSRITMEILLLKDRRAIDPLLKSRAENTARISELVTKIESHCDAPEEKQLLAAVKDARTPYVASYLRALHLLLDEHEPDAARALMVEETTPALFKYHAAWEHFVQSQMEQVDRAAKESRAGYATARALVLLLIVLAVLVATSIAVFATRTMAREMRTRLRAEREVRELNANLEGRVEQRTRELALSNQRLTSEIAERKSAQGREHLQVAALEAAANTILIADVTGKILWVNSAFTGLTGYSAEEVRGESPRILKSGKQDPSYYASLWKTITSGDVWHGEITNRRKDGSLYTEEMTITPVRADSGEITHFVAIKQDITKRKASDEALLHAEEKYRTIFENAVIGIFQVTTDGRFISANPALARMHGYDSPEQLIAEVSDCGRQLFVTPRQLKELNRVLEENDVANDVQVEVYCKNGSKKWFLANVCAVRGTDGNVLHHEGTVQDITPRKAAQERVQYLAYYDELTGLPNRRLLQDRLGQALATAQRRSEKVALLFLDLDRFKTINDSLGHSVGDLLLKEVAGRLMKWARAQDTVARLGGDEFVVVLTAVKDTADAAVAADRILKAMTAEFVVQGQSLGVSCSLGISLFPDHGADGETLLKNADTAMYRAKDNGNNFQFFTQDMNSLAVERLTLENSLRVALEREELFLEYQAQVDIATGNITGAEALLRWRHPELGLISPNRFIPIAENTGLIVPIGEWVLRTACAQARLWQDEGLPSITVAVNVSAVQFRQASFVQSVKKVLQETGLSPQCLDLELTERLLLPNSDVILVLQELTKEGVKLSIDDFGTGYSSLSYLRNFPIYRLKIDRSFVQDLAVAPDAAVITATIINMAKSLNLNVLAEGVENEEQLSFLRAKNCDEAQGYYFSRPIAAGAFAEYLRSEPVLQSDSQTTTPPSIGGHWAKLRWAREALSHSAQNSHITMEVLLLNDKLLIDPLLHKRATNTQKISELISKLEGNCTSEREKQLLAALNSSRAPYVASYLKALHLHLVEDRQEAARVIMLWETTPAWFKYHDAWSAILQYQMEKIRKATNQSRSLASNQSRSLASKEPALLPA